MEHSLGHDEWRTQVQPAIISKLEEFRLLGYDAITEQEFWEFLIKKKWRKAKEEAKLFEIIQDILSVKVSDYLSYAQIEAYKTAEFSFEDENELSELLK